MPVTAREAKAICTKPEYELFDASRKGNVEAFTPARLKQKVQRARKLRDKWRDESKRQRREKRGKAAPRGGRPAQSRDNTVAKADMFNEVLERFQAQLKKLEDKAAKEQAAKEKAKEKAAKAKAAKAVKAAKAKAKPAAGSKKKVVRSSVASKRSGKPKGVRTPKSKTKSNDEADGKASKAKPAKRAKVKGAGKKARYNTSGTKRTLGHVSSRNRRDQSRRDSRG